MNMFKGFDKYTIRARILPIMFTTLPVAIVAITWGARNPLGLGVIGWAMASCGGLLLIAQIGRDAGKRKEETLFALWEGKPTTRMLRHSCASNPILLARRHKKLKSLMQLSKFPTSHNEENDPEAADQLYDACVAFLREHTRNPRKFGLVYEENCNYGFRRNLWGMKPIGLSVAFLGLILSAGLFIHEWQAIDSQGSMFYALIVVVDAIIAITWVVVITPCWVRLAGEAYAERLIEASERL